MKMNKLMEKLDVIRSGHWRSTSSPYSDDEGARSKLWRFSTSYRESLSPTFSDGVLRGGRDMKFLSCVKFTAKKSKNLITVLVGKDRQAFQVEPQILDHGIVQCLVQKSRATAASASSAGSTSADNLCDLSRLRAGESPLYEQDICLDCDAILFEHILWLLSNDDPCLRNLNLEELMEFYT